MAKKLPAIIVAISLILASCSPRNAPPPPPQTPGTMFPNWPNELNGFRFRWTVESGIDLLTGPAIPLRAYLESYRVGFMTKSNADTYPGFQHAVPEIPDRRDARDGNQRWQELPYQLQWIWPAVDDHINFGDGPFFGNEYFHIMELSPTADGYLAYVCDGIYNIFHPSIRNPGKYASVLDYLKKASDALAREERSIRAWRIEFKNSGEAIGSTQPQTGKNPAPIGDVFGHWQITGASSDNYWGDLGNTTHTPRDPDYVQRLERCRDVMPHAADVRANIVTSLLDSPPPAEPAVPGWPDSAT
ncbi:hypothetical protein NLB33_34585 [Mycolicibacterium smegmatis]|uniref:hypothetical protein n=1 Tax=Mycolicibacterium smegmatis TaxID=1772 RepID=UPI0020A43BC7|nr:hypothetical protein [Mycolicibacterium smegmatis]MCP2627978.1 hypothetical protein [Mycolicibacterium smegmatis]